MEVSRAPDTGYSFRDPALLRTALTLYRSDGAAPEAAEKGASDAAFLFAMGALLLINAALGIGGGRVMALIGQGIRMFV